MNYYAAEGNLYTVEEANQSFRFDSAPETQESYFPYNHAGFSGNYASGVNSSSQFIPSHDVIVDNSNALLVTDMSFASSGVPRSASPPTPAELLELLDMNLDSYGPYPPTNGGCLSVAPSALHSPYVTPAHSRHGSLQSQPGYGQVYPSPFMSADPQALYSAGQFTTCTPATQYSAHLPAPIQVVNEPLTPPMSIAPGLVYSPAISRRSSSQHASTSTEPSPAIMRVNLTSCSPSASPFMGHARSPSTCSRHSDREESGTSAYSPYSHGRTVSSTSAFSPVTIPVTPHIRNASFSTSSHREVSPSCSVGTSNGMGGGFGKFPLDSRADLLAAAKKRKRNQFFGVEGSEDEYTAGADDAQVSDEDYDDGFGSKKSKFKKGKRMPKKQKLVQGATITALDDTDYAQKYSHEASPSDSGVTQPDDIKVWKLIPITKDDTLCPHCGFIPSNRRFSDLKRHHAKHLIKESKDKPRWVCLDCGDVEEIIVEEQAEDGTTTMRSVREYVLKAPVLKVYTRKDSGGRHWKQDHKEKQGMVGGDNRIVEVDRVRGEVHDGHSSSEA